VLSCFSEFFLKNFKSFEDGFLKNYQLMFKNASNPAKKERAALGYPFTFGLNIFKLYL